LCFWRERGRARAFELGLELVDVAQELRASFAFELECAFAFGVLGVEDAFDLGFELCNVGEQVALGELRDCLSFAFELECAFAFGVLGVEDAFDLGFELCNVGEQVALGELRDCLPFSFGELAPDRAFLFLNTDAGGGLGELQQFASKLGEFAPRLIEFVRVDERADCGDLQA